MERIVYRKTLDVHKNGIQFMLQGFETADNLSRVIEISLMASGDAIDFPLEKMVAMMYVTTPGATEPSINECEIKDNKVVYDVLPIVEEGITTMQLKIIETSVEGATGVLALPKFAVEVVKSGTNDEDAEQTTTFTALEAAMAKAKSVYDERFLRMELDSKCIFKAYYADGTVYETDVLQKLFLNGNVELSKSYAMGGTGVRAGEDTDNSMYYSNVARSEALKANDIMENSEEISEEIKLHGVYTAFGVNFETGDVEYVSPSFKFKVNLETGELDAEGQTYSFEDEVGRVVEDWLASKHIVISDLQNIATTHEKEITDLKETTETHTTDIADIKERVETLETDVMPIEKGGTGATTAEEARDNLGLSYAAKIQTGAYVGTGKYGEDNPNTLTFEFEPKVVRVFATYKGDNSIYTDIIGMYERTTFLRTSNVSTSYHDGLNDSESGHSDYDGIVTNVVIWEGNTLKWYAKEVLKDTDLGSNTYSNYAALQNNTEGVTYHYVALG